MSGSEDFEEAPPEHPAVKDFNRTGFQTTHVLGRTLKWAAAGAGIAVAVGIAALFSSGIGLIMGGIASLLGFGGAMLTGTLVAGALLGAIAGLVTSDPAGAADDEEERRIANYERAETRQERKMAMGQQQAAQVAAMQQQAQQLGLTPNPNLGLPAGRAPGGRMGGSLEA